MFEKKKTKHHAHHSYDDFNQIEICKKTLKFTTNFDNNVNCREVNKTGFTVVLYNFIKQLFPFIMINIEHPFLLNKTICETIAFSSCFTYFF